MTDRDLAGALAAVAEGSRETALVYPVLPPPAEGQLRRAAGLAGLVWDFRGDCSPGLQVVPDSSLQRAVLPEGGRVTVYTPSGAIEASMSAGASRPPLAEDERKADRPKILARIRDVVQQIIPKDRGKDEDITLEAVWETKAQGTTLRNEKSPIALLEAVGAFRRTVHGIPVMGRASVHVGIGGGLQVTKWGVDWRRRAAEPVAEARIVDPVEAARRIIADAQRRRPERPLTLRDLKPMRMMLGYLSLPRRQTQRVLEPAWMAIFAPAGGATSMGMVIAVSAAAERNEPLELQAAGWGRVGT